MVHAGKTKHRSQSRRRETNQTPARACPRTKTSPFPRAETSAVKTVRRRSAHIHIPNEPPCPVPNRFHSRFLELTQAVSQPTRSHLPGNPVSRCGHKNED